MKRSSLVAIIVVALVVVGIVIYLARPRPEEFAVATPAATANTSQPIASAGPAPATSAPAAVVSCIGPAGNGQSQIAALNTQHQYARSLVEKKHFETALPALRGIALSAPGYPGIYLDISD